MFRMLFYLGLIAITGSSCSARPGVGSAALTGERQAMIAAPAEPQAGQSTSPKDAAGAPWSRRMVIKTAELTLLSDDLEGGFAKASSMARKMGGYTSDAIRSTESVSVTLRVPTARFEEAVLRLTKLGEIKLRRVGGEDVTAQFVDLTMRLQNKERMRKRYLALLERAANVGEAVKIQRELERITGEIESLKGQVNLINSRVGMSTIDLVLETPTRPGPVGWIFYGLFKGVYWLFVWD